MRAWLGGSSEERRKPFPLAAHPEETHPCSLFLPEKGSYSCFLINHWRIAPRRCLLESRLTSLLVTALKHRLMEIQWVSVGELRG